MDALNGNVVYSHTGIVPRPVERKRYHWTTREIATLRATYDRGIHACMDVLPGRTEGAIYQQANILGLRSPKHPHRKRRWITTDHIDDAIRRAYLKPDRGTISRLAMEMGRPKSWIRDRAIRLGITTPRYRPEPWSDAEDQIVREMAGQRHVATIQRALARAGHKRTETAIIVRMKRIGESRKIISDTEFNGHQLAELLGLDSKTVSTWIMGGLLKAKAGGAERDDGRPTQWRIKRGDIRAFILDQPARIDLRKVERFWFIELLGSG